MPIYCYKCFDCNYYDEVTQRITDKPLTVCPECGGDYKRVIRNVGVIFKGPGFHVTDYGSKKSALTGKNETSTGEEKASSEKTEKTGEDAAKTENSTTVKSKKKAA